MKTKYFLWLGLLASLLVGCTQTVRTRVNSFRAPEPIPLTASIAVVPADVAQGQSLEYGLYKGLLELSLVKQGFTLSSPEQAQLHALLSFTVDRVAKSNDSGIRTGVMVGSNPSRSGFGSSVMILDGARNAEWFERKLAVVIEHNNKDRQRVYEITAQSEGACGVLSAVIPDMLVALFAQFPMENGAIKYVSVPVTEKCR